jgi:hypothetical protein
MRLDDLRKFYAALSVLEQKLGGARTLGSCSGRMKWPQRGVYFFRELGEERADSGGGPRVVRVGTHALKENGSTILWTRLSQHRGRVSSGSGNHRGSIFRLIVGKSLIAQRGYEFPTWGNGNNALRLDRRDSMRRKEACCRPPEDAGGQACPVRRRPGSSAN